MRKAISGTLSLSLFLSIISSSLVAQAAVKSGSVCTKSGATSVVGGKKFTCVKSGKKLLWDKGVLVPVAKPAPSVTPSDKAPVAPVVTYPEAPTSFEDLLLNYKGIAYGAWSKSRKKILESVKADITLKVVLGPNTQLTNKEPQKAIDLVTRLYPGYPTNAEIYFLAFNFADRDWATNQMETILPNSGSGWIADVACNSKETCWGGGAFSNGAGKYLIVETMGYIDANHTSGSLEAHEFTHIVQQMSFKKGRPPAAYLFDPWPPTWYWEGQAHFAQHASVYFDSYESYMNQRRLTSQDLYKDSTFNSKNIQNYFVFNAPADWRQNYERWREYDLGAMFVEILTALKGPESTMEMWRITGTGVNFPVAFETVYGISFEKAMPIMSKAIALELGRS